VSIRIGCETDSVFSFFGAMVTAVSLSTIGLSVVTRRKTPVYSDDLLMQEARDLHLAANGFSIGDYEANTFTNGIFGLRSSSQILKRGSVRFPFTICIIY
jgi:hypothetical protein